MLDVERMPQRIGIGRETETGVTDIEIDVSAWRTKWPGLTISAMHTPQGGSPYVLDTELQGDTLVWHVSDADTASAGDGQMEIIGTAEGVRKLSCVVGVVVTGRMPGTVGDAPDAAKPWADKVLAAAEIVRSSAEDARDSASSAQASAEAAQEAAEGVVTAEAERVQAEQARKEAEKAREEVLPSKLTEPSSGLEVGKYFRIAAIDENGHAVLEAVDAPVGGLSTEPSLWPLWASDEQAAARERMGIPSGYELIEEITLSEAVDSILRTSEPDGTAYNLANAFLSVYVPMQDDGYIPRTIWVYFRDYKNFNAGRLYISISNAIKKDVYIRAEQRTSNGIWLNAVGEFGAENIASTRMTVYNVKTKNSNITGINIVCSLPAGTVIQIYGVIA